MPMIVEEIGKDQMHLVKKDKGKRSLLITIVFFNFGNMKGEKFEVAEPRRCKSCFEPLTKEIRSELNAGCDHRGRQKLQGAEMC